MHLFHFFVRFYSLILHNDLHHLVLYSYLKVGPQPLSLYYPLGPFVLHLDLSINFSC